MGIQPLGILKLLLFPSFCTSSRKIPFASLFYMLFCFISYMYIAQGHGKTIHRDNYLMEAERSYHFDHWLHFSKMYLCLLILFTFFFQDFIHVYNPQRADSPFNPNGTGGKILMSTERPHHLVICCKFQKKIFSL